MRTERCGECGAVTPIAGMWRVADAPCCGACAERVVAERGPFREDQVARMFDATVCANCGFDGGERELPRLANLPTCEGCCERLRNRPFPLWIRASLAALLALLVASQVVGARYFGAATNVVRAERRIGEKEYAEASALLAAALKEAPDSGKALLLKAKADFLAGNPAAAFEALKRFGNRTDEQELIAELNRIGTRVEQAFAKVQEASRLDEKDDAEGALKAGEQAARLYPESKDIAGLVEMLRAGLAFNSKDYQTFHDIYARLVAQHPDSHMHVAGLASALACRYAVSGDTALKAQAEEKLARAESLVRTDEDRAAFDEYAQRIRHRLDTREILSRAEYNRRFRSPPKED